MQLERGEEQLGAGRVQRLVQPWCAQFALITGPGRAQVGIPEVFLVLRALGSESCLRVSDFGEVVFGR